MTRKTRKIRGGWPSTFLANVNKIFVGDTVVDLTRDIILGTVDSMDHSTITMQGRPLLLSDRGRTWAILKRDFLPQARQISEQTKSQPQGFGPSWSTPKPQIGQASSAQGWQAQPQMGQASSAQGWQAQPQMGQASKGWQTQPLSAEGSSTQGFSWGKPQMGQASKGWQTQPSSAEGSSTQGWQTQPQMGQASSTKGFWQAEPSSAEGSSAKGFSWGKPQMGQASSTQGWQAEPSSAEASSVKGFWKAEPSSAQGLGQTKPSSADWTGVLWGKPQMGQASSAKPQMGQAEASTSPRGVLWGKHATIITKPLPMAKNNFHTKDVKVNFSSKVSEYSFMDDDARMLENKCFIEFLRWNNSKDKTMLSAEEIESFEKSVELTEWFDPEIDTEVVSDDHRQFLAKFDQAPPPLTVLRDGMITSDIIKRLGKVEDPPLRDLIVREFCRLNDRPVPKTEDELFALQPKSALFIEELTTSTTRKIGETKFPVPCLPDCVEKIWHSISSDVRRHQAETRTRNKYIIFAPGDSPSKFMTYISLLDSFKAECDELNIEFLSFPLSSIGKWEPTALDAYIGPLIKHPGVEKQNVYFGLVDSYSEGLKTVHGLTFLLMRLGFPNLLEIPIKGISTWTTRIMDFTKVKFGFQTEPFGDFYSNGESLGFDSRFAPRYEPGMRTPVPSTTVYNCNIYILFWYAIRHLYKKRKDIHV